MNTKSTTTLAASLLIAIALAAPNSVAEVAIMEEVPFLCAEDGDGSSARFVNTNGSMNLSINIAEKADRAGAQISVVSGMPAKSVSVSGQGNFNDIVALATYSEPSGIRTVALKPTSVGIGQTPSGTVYLLGYNLNAPQGSKFQSLYVVDNYNHTAQAKGKVTISEIDVNGVPVNGKSLEKAQCMQLPDLAPSCFSETLAYRMNANLIHGKRFLINVNQKALEAC